MFLLISKNRKFIFIKKTDESSFRKESEKFYSKSVDIWKHPKETCLIKKGDSVPFESNSELFLIKTKGKIINRKFKFLEKDDKEKKLIKVATFLRKLNLEKLNEVKSKLNEIVKDEEVYYRIFYNSFKMYRIRYNCFELAQSLLYLSGQSETLVFDKENYKQILNFNDFDKTLQILINQVFDTQFTLFKNEKTSWANDSKTLVGTQQLLVESLKMLIKFSEDFLNKAGYFYSKRSFLDWHEAGSMEIFIPLSILRYDSEKTLLFLNEEFKFINKD